MTDQAAFPVYYSKKKIVLTDIFSYQLSTNTFSMPKLLFASSSVMGAVSSRSVGGVGQNSLKNTAHIYSENEQYQAIRATSHTWAEHQCAWIEVTSMCLEHWWSSRVLASRRTSLGASTGSLSSSSTKIESNLSVHSIHSGSSQVGSSSYSPFHFFPHSMRITSELYY